MTGSYLVWCGGAVVAAYCDINEGSWFLSSGLIPPIDLFSTFDAWTHSWLGVCLACFAATKSTGVLQVEQHPVATLGAQNKCRMYTSLNSYAYVMTSESTLMEDCTCSSSGGWPTRHGARGSCRMTRFMPAMVFRPRSCLAVPWRSFGRRAIDPPTTSAIHLVR
jgi:hypothetical protein